VSKLRFSISISLDGYVAGRDQTLETPLGVGGEALHEWALATRSWRAAHGREGGATGIDDDRIAAAATNVGATIMGRNMFGPVRGPWEDDDPWQGWWGDEPPFHTPVFVLTHHAREPLALQGTTFHFVTDGIESALEQARAAAGERDVAIGGGAQTARQYLQAGLVDEFEVHVVPVLLGGGEPLFDGTVGYDGVELVASPTAAHFRFARVR
jgi:dihydrofolate reductase